MGQTCPRAEFSFYSSRLAHPGKYMPTLHSCVLGALGLQSVLGLLRSKTNFCDALVNFAQICLFIIAVVVSVIGYMHSLSCKGTLIPYILPSDIRPARSGRVGLGERRWRRRGSQCTRGVSSSGSPEGGRAVLLQISGRRRGAESWLKLQLSL